MKKQYWVSVVVLGLGITGIALAAGIGDPGGQSCGADSGTPHVNGRVAGPAGCPARRSSPFVELFGPDDPENLFLANGRVDTGDSLGPDSASDA